MSTTILILAANPKDTPPLRLEEEVREIENGLQRARKRDEFILISKWAVRRAEVRRAMLDLKPHIVHFCGHGERDQIVIEDETGHGEFVDAETLAEFFALFAETLKCVVLNACYSETQAEAIAYHIDYVVGMKKEIGDRAAIEFSVAFYDALAAGESIEFAYQLARNAIRWTGMPEHLTPILKREQSTDVSPEKHKNIQETSVAKSLVHTGSQISEHHVAVDTYARLYKAMNDLALNSATASGADPLYSRWIVQQAKDLANKTLSWINGYLEYGPELAESKVIEIVIEASKGGFTTQLVRTTQGWDINKRIYRACRDVAKRGIPVTRLFILDGKQALSNRSLQSQVEMDKQSGMAVYLAFVENIQEVVAIREFSIWDDKYVCTFLVDPLQGKTIGCRIECSQDGSREAQKWRSYLQEYATEATEVLRGFPRVDEIRYRSDFGGGQEEAELAASRDLALSAHIQLDYSDKYCVGGNVDPVSCRWYHSAWQYLRLVDMVVTPDRHAEFFQGRLATNLEARETHILICGLADYAMLAHVRDAIRATGGNHEITVLDVCRTPLKMCEWYAERYGLAINVARGDALDTQFKDNSFDAIVTDAMLTRFNPNERKLLVNEWQRILRSGGVLLTTARISPGVTIDKPSLAKAKGFVAKAMERAKTVRLDIDSDTFEKLATDYARNIVSLPCDGEGELHDLFASFDTDVKVVESKGKFEATRKYAEVEARIIK